MQNTLLRMDFGYRFPALDTSFRDVVRSRVQAALESGDVTPPFGGTALLLAAGHVVAQVFPRVDTTMMDEVVGDTTLAGAGSTDAATVVVLQQVTAVLQQTTLR